jgi:hypothetical protein
VKNYDFIFILVCLFVFRIIALSGSFADAICLIALLAYMFGNKYLVIKQVSNDVVDQVNKEKEANAAKYAYLADQIEKTRNAAEGVKAALNFTGKR